jgi:acylphosphatase
MPTKYLRIRGNVQGVFYRATVKEVADKIGISGWVKNTADGDVEALISGTDDQLQTFIEWCWQGPPAAIVTAIKIEERTEEAVVGFIILRD